MDPDGVVHGRLLVSGMSPSDGECEIPAKPPPGGPFGTIAYTGVSHKNLNKDSEPPRTDPDWRWKHFKHQKARALATLQTGYEWCRLVREARLADRDGLLLALWVRKGADPHRREPHASLLLRDRCQ